MAIVVVILHCVSYDCPFILKHVAHIIYIVYARSYDVDKYANIRTAVSVLHLCKDYRQRHF